MQKKCLLFIMAFNCIVAQANDPKLDLPEKKDFSQLPENLRQLRENDEDAQYADKMVDGVSAIDKEIEEKINAVEKARKERRRKISTAGVWYGYEDRAEPGTWWYGETSDTEVYKLDKKIDDEANEIKEIHRIQAKQYKDWSTFMHQNLSQEITPELKATADRFSNMYQALKNCSEKDQSCYDRYCAPAYEKMVNPQYRRMVQERPYEEMLKDAHAKGIPILGSELKKIVQKAQKNNGFNIDIQALEDCIDELVNPVKIQARKELEDQRAKDEQDKADALKKELEAKNTLVDPSGEAADFNEIR